MSGMRRFLLPLVLADPPEGSVVDVEGQEARIHFNQLLNRLRSRVHHASRAFCSGGGDDDVVDRYKEVQENDEFYGVIRGKGGVETVPLTVENVAIPGSGRNKVNLVDLVPPPVAD